MKESDDISHKLEREMGEEREIIEIPAVCRKQVLKLAHSNKISGHFSHKKPRAALMRMLTGQALQNLLKNGAPHSNMPKSS